MKRATLVFFDEAAFSSDELIAVCEAFATQNTEFKTSKFSTFNPKTLKRKVPTQLVYASSQDSMDKMFYKHYKNFAKKMLSGDRNYFVCDMICDTAIKTFMKGKPYTPLLTQDKVDTAMKSNRLKASREYYNEPTLDGGNDQIVKWGTVRRNENFTLPSLTFEPNYKYIFALDPSRTNDNSILGIMRVYEDKDYGYMGDIINVRNFLDEASKKNYKLDSNRQLAEIRNSLYTYCDTNLMYENLECFLIDAGSGGSGVSTYGDGLINDWVDRDGRNRKGLIDLSHPIYKGYRDVYPNTVDKIRLINPKGNRNKMVEDFIDLMNMGVIKFPYDFKNEYVSISRNNDDDSEDIISYQLSSNEIVSLEEIYLMKEEITSIYKTNNKDNTSVTYALPPDKANKMHDDRFYVAILLAHGLYNLRRGQTVLSEPKESVTLENAPFCVSAVTL